MATTVTLKPNAIDLSGSTSGTTTLQATAVAGTTTITLPAATDTLVGKATTDTLTNKTLTGAVMNGTLGATTPSTVAATTISASSTATFAAGAVGTPSITTTGDTNTGIFFPAADTIAFSEGGAEAMRIDSSGNVGIGTSSPSTYGKLAVYGVNAGGDVSANIINFATSASTTTSLILSDTSGDLVKLVGDNAGSTSSLRAVNRNTQLSFWTGATGGAERMRIDSSGNVGIGRTPDQRLQIAQPTNVEFDMFVGSTRTLSLYADATQTQIGTPNAIPMIFKTSDAERMRIDSSGNLLVGTTSANVGFTTGSKSLCFNSDYGGSYPVAINHSVSGNGYFLGFGRGGSQCGYIWTNASNSTQYVTSSDYRLKENIVPMTGALAKVSALKPVTYTWKEDGTSSQGFIAHELQEIVPEAVAGAKDALNEDGSIKPQGIDTSFLVATLTAALQELKQINDTQAETINALTARIVALEAK
jgi:hypothetical protein